jgi:hypothetical protein
MQSTVDAAEQRMIYTARLDKATADAAEIKAAYDKVGGAAACSTPAYSRIHGSCLTQV